MTFRILDLFCGAGGAAAGYQQVGFDVIGVDLLPQPRYPGTVHQGDAFAVGLDLLHHSRFDAVHASPPCQAYSSATPDRSAHEALVWKVRAFCVMSGLPYVIENVPGAKAEMQRPLMLCGQDPDIRIGVFRHRLFEVPWLDYSDWWKKRPHRWHNHPQRIGQGVVTVAGSTGGSRPLRGIRGATAAEWAKAMEIDWMPARSMAQAVPPAYTRWIGRHLRAHFSR